MAFYASLGVMPRLSLLAATKPEVLRTLARIHAEELGRHYKAATSKTKMRTHPGSCRRLLRAAPSSSS